MFSFHRHVFSLFIDIVKSVMSVLTHHSPAARLAAAWCLRSIAIAVPALLTPLLEKNMENLDKVCSIYRSHSLSSLIIFILEIFLKIIFSMFLWIFYFHTKLSTACKACLQHFIRSHFRSVCIGSSWELSFLFGFNVRLDNSNLIYNYCIVF